MGAMVKILEDKPGRATIELDKPITYISASFVVNLARHELGLDKGVTVSPEDFQVTDELIEKIRKGEV